MLAEDILWNNYTFYKVFFPEDDMYLGCAHGVYSLTSSDNCVAIFKEETINSTEMNSLLSALGRRYELVLYEKRDKYFRVGVIY